MRMDRTLTALFATLILGTSIVSAGLLNGPSWNPFSSDQTNPEPKASSSSFFRSPFDYFRREDPTDTAPSVKDTNQPITSATRRAILEASRNYPLGERQKFLAKFAGVNEQQAQEMLAQSRGQTSKNAEINNSTQQNQSSPRGTASTSRPRTSSTSGLGESNPWVDMNSGTPTSRSPRMTRPPVSKPGSADLSSRTPQTSTRTHQPYLPGTSRIQSSPLMTKSQPGTAQTRQPSPTPTPSFPSSAKPTAGESSLRGPSLTGNMPQAPAGLAPSLPQINPAMKQGVASLPKVKPAAGSQDTSHYAGHYQPASANIPAARATPVAAERTTYRSPSVPTQSVSGTLHGPELPLLIARAEQAVASATPGRSEAELQDYITKHVELRLLYLIAGQRSQALTTIKGIDENEQIFWQRVFWALSYYMDAQNYPDKADRTTISLGQLRKAILTLQGDAQMEIRHASFCSEIEGFGNYKRFEKNEFSPGQEILVYSELNNFHSERTAEGQYRTLLKSSLRVYEAGDESHLIDEVQYNATEDLCRSQRMDFMQGFKYRLPQRLSPGAYELKLIVEDQQSGKSTEYSLSFLVR